MRWTGVRSLIRKTEEMIREKRFLKNAFSMLSTPTTSREQRLMAAKQNEAVTIRSTAVVLLLFRIVIADLPFVG